MTVDLIPLADRDAVMQHAVKIFTQRLEGDVTEGHEFESVMLVTRCECGDLTVVYAGFPDRAAKDLSMAFYAVNELTGGM